MEALQQTWGKLSDNDIDAGTTHVQNATHSAAVAAYQNGTYLKNVPRFIMTEALNFILLLIDCLNC